MTFSQELTEIVSKLKMPNKRNLAIPQSVNDHSWMGGGIDRCHCKKNPISIGLRKGKEESFEGGGVCE